MKLITVIPIKRNSNADALTYFTSQEISAGDVVSVPLRLRNIEAIVTDVKDAAEEKTALKTSGIRFRKVLKVFQHKPILSACVKAAEKTARYYVAPIGAVLGSVVPSSLWKHKNYQAPEIVVSSIPEISILQADDEERFVQYRSLVREAFRRNESVVVLTPTIQDSETIALSLSKGIEDYALVLNSYIAGRALSKTIERIGKETHPLIVVTTPGFLALMPARTGTIILERENSSAYKQMARPFVDFRYFARSLANEAKLRLVLGDTLLSSETIERYEEGSYQELITPKWRVMSQASAALIDMRTYKPDLRGKLKIISDELRKMILETKTASDHLFIFTGRKGLAPSTLCGDCGSLLVCKRCERPLVLHKSASQSRFYLCHHCGKREDATLRCRECTSWKLNAFGTGTEIVEETVKSLGKNLNVIRLDGESAKNRKEALQLSESFYSSPGSIMIGTELALPYLKKPIGFVAVASVDELFSVPDFRINERVMYLLLKLKSMALRNFMVQTRNPEHEIIRAAIDGNLGGFYQSELSIRKALLYPPFSVLVKISLYGNPERITETMKTLSNNLPVELNIFPTFVKKGKGKAGLSGIMKVPPEKWPDDEIISQLRSLPPSAEINVSPENLI